MKLRLLLRGPSRLVSTTPEKTLETGHMIIGRSPDADWTIDDPNRVISKAHCRIDGTERGFMVTDTSTNGVRINEVPVGRGLPSLLANGDVLMLGDAIIAVEIAATAPPAPIASPPLPAYIPPSPPLPASPAAPVAVTTTIKAPSGFPSGPFGFDEAVEADLTEATVREVPLEASKAEVSRPVMEDWWDPNAASGKPGLPLSGDVIPGSVGIEAAIPDMSHASAFHDGDAAQTLSRAAGSVDARKLMEAVEMAAQVLTRDEREKFERRLREILQQENGAGSRLGSNG